VLLQAAQETEAGIRRLTVEREALVSKRVAGLSAEDAEILEQFAREVRAGIGEAMPQERRRIYDLLQLRGRIRRTPEGVSIGHRYRFSFEWTAHLRLAGIGSGFSQPEPEFIG